MHSPEQILGVRFFGGTVDEAVDSLSAGGGLLVVPAAPALVKLSEDEGYRRALVSADMAIADSGAMVLLWRIFTGRRVERISGLKFLKRLVRWLASHPEERVLWIVPSEQAHEKTIDWLRSVTLTRAADPDVGRSFLSRLASARVPSATRLRSSLSQWVQAGWNDCALPRQAAG